MAGDDIADLIPLIESRWESVPLGNVTVFVNGDRGKNYPSQSDYVSRGVPFISAADLMGGRVDAGNCTFITEAAFDRLGGGKTKEGDLLFCLRGSLGKVARVRSIPRGAIASSLVIIRATDQADKDYLYYILSGPLGQRLAAELNNGSVQPNISARSLKESCIPLPPIAEQKAIAAVLGALDDKIELNRRMNATMEAMARALFQSWFVDFDPVRAKLDGRPPAALDPDSFQDSELGPIPFGWTVSKLKDLTSKIGSGATPRGGSEVYVDEGLALIRSQNVYDHEFRWAGLARLSDKSASELKNVEVMKDDVLLNITGDSILRTCVVDPTVLPARVNQHVAIIRAIKGIPPRYLHLYLVQDSMKSFLIGMSAGATRHAITKGHLESTDVLKPSAQVLAAFEKLTSPWFEQIDANRAQSRTLATLRDTLLPKLLSGELSVAGGNSPDFPESSNQRRQKQ
jgi:type I restriction enzyme S subunit